MGSRGIVQTLATKELAHRGAVHMLSFMNRPIHVQALPQYRLRITYVDGTEGVIDLAEEVGHGIFTPLTDGAFFQTVHIGEFGQIAWSNDIEICPDAAYREITSRTSVETVHA